MGAVRMSKTIPLTRGKVAIVDDEDYEWLNQWKWCCSDRMYAVRGKIHGDKLSHLSMHRVILSAKEGDITDHINRDKLDNRRSNLRLCTPAESARNQNLRKDNKSGYKGVHWHPVDKKWCAKICVHGKRTFLGNYDQVEDAARAYDQAAIELHGEFARLNFPEKGLE